MREDAIRSMELMLSSSVSEECRAVAGQMSTDGVPALVGLSFDVYSKADLTHVDRSTGLERSRPRAGESSPTRDELERPGAMGAPQVMSSALQSSMRARRS